MRMRAFASRNVKEIIRDPLTLFFGLGFPVIVLLLLTAIEHNIPGSNPSFNLDQLTPGMAVFGLSFISLFSGMLLAKDRSTSFLVRLFASPMSSRDFILAYALPLLPMAVAQSVICFLLAFVLGLPVTFSVLPAILVLVPAALFFIGIGLITGSVLNDKQVGGICGALLTNLCAWLSGAWFDVKLIGGAFEKIANLLPFCHAVDAARAALAGDYASILPDLAWVVGWAVISLVAAVLIFNKKMRA